MCVRGVTQPTVASMAWYMDLLLVRARGVGMWGCKGGLGGKRWEGGSCGVMGRALRVGCRGGAGGGCDGTGSAGRAKGGV